MNMADADEKPKPARKNTSGAAFGRSGNSRALSPNPGLSRLISGRHLDDHAQYHGAGYHGEQQQEEVFDDDESSDETDLTEKDPQETRDIEPESSGDIVPEVRNGVEDERDVEAGPKLEKSKTTRSGRSARDPNLVTWTGPEDPDNPKNWSMGRKWAATLVGT
jgi:hypothetical protein